MSFLDFLFGGKNFREFRNSDEGYSLQVPADWRVVSITEEYGYAFSDEERKEGMLAVRLTSSLFENLEDFSDDLIDALESRNDYRLVSKARTKVAGLRAVEALFDAKAKAGGKTEDARVITSIMHDREGERFILITFSVLRKDYGKRIGIYEKAKRTFALIRKG